MLSSPTWRIVIGSLLLVAVLAGSAIAVGRDLLLNTRRHVVVKISNVDGIEQAFINCHLAIRVESGESGETVDLGWLRPDDRIFLSTTSIDRNPAWGFSGTSNGSFLFEESRGDAELPQFTTPADAVVFAKAFSADGAELGTIGCQPPKIVVVDGYTWSPDDKQVAEQTDAESSYRRPNALYDLIDTIGRLSLVALALLGAGTALCMPTIRRATWSHKGRLAGGALALLGAGFIGISILLTTLTLAGTLLLLALAILLIVTGVNGLKSAAGTGGP